MKKSSFIAFAAAFIMLLSLSACSHKPAQGDAIKSSTTPKGQIYLYGEQHGVKKILDKELELWYENYDNKNMRHLFIELPYYTAEFLNVWMQSESDDILNTIYDEWNGTMMHTPDVIEFYKNIKSRCPETIFHGTDVGHQYDTTGERFLDYLETNKLKDSDQYTLAREAIEQGKYYYKKSDDVYRENKMAENFIREFDKLSGESVMGIYGGAHTDFDAMDNNTQSVPCMANQLKKVYTNNIYSEDLAWLAKEIEPIREDTITISNKKYTASYFGKEDLTGFKDYASREFWRLENAYNDFKASSKTGDVLPYDNYPMQIETGQVFVIDYTKTDGSVIRGYYRSDGYVWNGAPSTEEFAGE